MNSLQQIELMEVEEIQALELTQEFKFEITDLGSLTWAFRRLAALKAKEKEIKQLADVERDRIGRWEQTELNPITNSISFFESHIQLFHSQQLASDPKAKTISTPYGKSKSRTTKETPDKANEAEILQHVIENGMDDYIKNSLKWADFKKAVKIVELAGEKVVVDENGQLVPGMTVKPESISYSVEV
ncbi:host-nuclease inhibitor Gam family protein [Neobacillus sp. NPDC093127]|uniref:host-nuclease inhibitor Gam family protein n=1 Tax=Neobacillus sp. NPDC093127 TaxID=3364296 RepID=UPI00381D9976